MNTHKTKREAEESLVELRHQVYESFPYRADALMDTVDALSGNTTASSVAELSLSPLFGREYGSLYDGIDTYTEFLQNPELSQAPELPKLAELVMPYAAEPAERPFWLLATDGTPVPRPYARTLPDRSFVYAPNPTPGVKPVTLGHQASSVVLLPEKAAGEPAWVVPLGLERIPSSSGEIPIALKQIEGLLNDESLPFQDELTMTVADSKHGQVPFLYPLVQHEHHVVMTRVRGNRVFYRPAPPPDPDAPKTRGRPKIYGERFALGEAETWGTPQQSLDITMTSTRGHCYGVHIQQWDDLLMRGKRDMPMADHPFNLLRIEIFRPDGTPLYKRPMWLVVIGERRAEIETRQAWEAYRQRFDQEHFFRFGKRRLLLDKFQTPDADREVTWLYLTQLAYIQLWMARSLAHAVPMPWQRYLPLPPDGLDTTPSHTQRDFTRIIGQIGTPAAEAKPRGNSSGRPPGTQMASRTRHPVVRKGKKSA